MSYVVPSVRNAVSVGGAEYTSSRTTAESRFSGGAGRSRCFGSGAATRRGTTARDQGAPSHRFIGDIDVRQDVRLAGRDPGCGALLDPLAEALGELRVGIGGARSVGAGEVEVRRAIGRLPLRGV